MNEISGGAKGPIVNLYTQTKRIILMILMYLMNHIMEACHVLLLIGSLHLFISIIIQYLTISLKKKKTMTTTTIGRGVDLNNDYPYKEDQVMPLGYKTLS